MKKIIVIALVISSLLLSLCSVCVAAGEPLTAYVTVYDGEKIVAAMEEVPYSDEDNDGKWTINDLLISVHNSKCKDGFATSEGDYGLFITKLWGIENGGSYGYYLNNQMAMGLTDEVTAGSVLYAYVYSDTATFSDAYSFFDKFTAETEDKAVTLTLKYISGFDPETYAPIESPLEGAVITLDGKETEFVTDADGKVEITLTESALISAKKEGLVLIPPVCAAEVKPYAYVNIYDGESVVLAMYKVGETDEDGDGAWTINDVLISAHNEKCKDGFATANSDYGLFITKLWGVENGGSYGYYKNNVMSMGLTEQVNDGDVVYAYAYSDTATFSDAYSFFDTYKTEGETVTLTLKYISGFDPETYAPIEAPLEGAVITVDGKDTEFVTGADGKVEITLTANAVIGAKKDGLLLIPPVCLFSLKKAGDINEDGEVDNKDVVVLFRYVSGAEKADNEAKYDYNGDGEVDNKDVVSLFRAVSVK